MDPIYFSIGGLVLVIVLFKRELVVRKNSFVAILGLSITLFLIGLILHFTGAGHGPTSGVLLVPLVSLVLYRIIRRLFVKWFKHEPRDTFLNWAPGMAADRLFNILYFSLAGLLWALAPFGMQQLEKAGW